MFLAYFTQLVFMGLLLTCYGEVYDDHLFNLTIRMPDVTSAKPDALVCHGVRIDPRESYIVGYVPHATADVAHHMMVFGCGEMASNQPYWSCTERYNRPETSVCKNGEKQVVFAWALDAPSFSFPEGVGLRVGGTTGINYIVIQLHYKEKFKSGRTDNSGVTLKFTNTRQPKQAGFYVIGTSGFIPPKKLAFKMETACEYSTGYPMYPIGYRTHSHNLGVVTSGYRIRDGKWTELGRMSPQLPETFYNVSTFVDVQEGDVLAARCTMNSMKRTRKTYIGPTNADEMCNFYVMYYTYWQPDLRAQFCFRDAQKFHWEDYFENIPMTASSLVGIPGADKVKEIFNLINPLPKETHPKHGTM